MFYRISWSLPIFLFCFCISAVPAFSGPDTPYQAITDKFFENLSKSRYEDAFDQLYAHNRWIQKDNPPQFAQTRSQYLAFMNMIGPYRGKAKLAERETAGMLVHQLYMVMFDRGPIGIRFQYYKLQGAWELFGFWSVNDINMLLGQRAEQEVLLPMSLPPPAKPSAVDLPIERESAPSMPQVRKGGD